MSKRKLLQLVNEKRVSGWDDPRMPTLAGMRRRGVTPEALQDFAEMIGVAKNNSIVDIGKLEFAIRARLESLAPRAMGVLRPLRVVVTNWPEGAPDEELTLPWWPGEAERGGSRVVPFGRELLIEREDFSENPPKDWKRLAPGREVRLIGAYVLRCDEIVRSGSGELVELRCSYDPASKGGSPADGRKVSGTLHWVHATRSVPVPVRLYDRLFSVEQPDAEADFLSVLNPASLAIAEGARVEPALKDAATPGTRWQFLREGYFFVDPIESTPWAPVFNRIIGLKDTWTAKGATPVVSTQVSPASVASATPTAPKKSRVELRAEQRAASPELAARFERYQNEAKLA
jgi:glutaminyl-tRNA synthetase